MSARTGILAAGVAYSAYKVFQWAVTSEHDKVLKETFTEVNRQAGDQRSLLVDHINPRDGDGSPSNINGFRPDLELRDFASPNLLVEVETADSLDSTALEQLKAFRKPGYKRVLVVPEGVENEAEKFVSNLDGPVHITTPSKIGQDLF